jgi:hypothetical protein
MRRVNISQLAFPCVTRARGEEASKKILGYIDIDQIEVDFNSVEMVSLSFLDGFVTNLMKSTKEENVIFIINSQIEEKLSRIAGMRKATIYHCLDGKAIQPVEPKVYESNDPVFVPNKAALRR